MKTFLDATKAFSNKLTARFPAALLSWVRDRRGSAGVEFVLGTAVIAMTTVVGLDLYRIAAAQSATLRAAVTVADYVSQETAPTAAAIDDLSRFSYVNEIALPAHAVFVVSAVSRAAVTDEEPDPPALVRWSRMAVLAEDVDPSEVDLREGCGRLGLLEDGEAAVQKDLEMAPGEMVVVVEVCVELLPESFTGGRFFAANLYPTRFYQHQVLPVRGASLPPEPA